MPTPTARSAADRSVSIQAEDFDLAAESERLHRSDPRVGALASFVGTVRARPGGAALQTLYLEHYPGMTEAAIEAICDAAFLRFDGLRSVRVVHRVGELALGDRIVFVGAAAAHRSTAFQACEFVMDYLKTQAPFWKKETLADGNQHWVDAREADDAALARWGIETRNAA